MLREVFPNFGRNSLRSRFNWGGAGLHCFDKRLLKLAHSTLFDQAAEVSCPTLPSLFSAESCARKN